jgi:hypothetical protein
MRPLAANGRVEELLSSREFIQCSIQSRYSYCVVDTRYFIFGFGANGTKSQIDFSRGFNKATRGLCFARMGDVGHGSSSTMFARSGGSTLSI